MRVRRRGMAWAWVGWAVQMVLVTGAEGVGEAAAATVATPVMEAVLEAGTTGIARRREEMAGRRGEEGDEGRDGARRNITPALDGEEAIESHKVCQIATLNVDGRMRLEGREEASNWGSGAEVEATATRDWQNVESYMEGKSLVVLTDVCMNGPQLKAAMARLEGAATGRGSAMVHKGASVRRMGG